MHFKCIHIAIYTSLQTGESPIISSNYCKTEDDRNASDINSFTSELSNYSNLYPSLINQQSMQFPANKLLTANVQSLGVLQENRMDRVQLRIQSWIFDHNFFAKLRLTFVSGLSFGLTQILFIAALSCVPINLDFVFQSLSIFICTCFVKYTAFEDEIIDSFGIGCSICSFLFMLPFIIQPFKGDDIYNNSEHGTQYIIIACLCDFCAAISIFCTWVLFKKLCLIIKPSQLRFDNDREPSIIEIAFFLSFWSTIITFVACVLFDFVLCNKQIFSETETQNNSISQLFQIMDNSEIIRYLVLSVFLAVGHTFSFIGALSVLKILSVSVLFQIGVVSHVFIYFCLIEKSSVIQWWKLSFLISGYLACFAYLLRRVFIVKGNQSWRRYLVGLQRVESSESFNTALAYKGNVRRKNNDDIYVQFDDKFSSVAGSLHRKQNRRSSTKNLNFEESVDVVSVTSDGKMIDDSSLSTIDMDSESYEDEDGNISYAQWMKQKLKWIWAKSDDENYQRVDRKRKKSNKNNPLVSHLVESIDFELRESSASLSYTYTPTQSHSNRTYYGPNMHNVAGNVHPLPFQSNYDENNDNITCNNEENEKPYITPPLYKKEEDRFV